MFGKNRSVCGPKVSPSTEAPASSVLAKPDFARGGKGGAETRLESCARLVPNHSENSEWGVCRRGGDSAADRRRHPGSLEWPLCQISFGAR